MNKAKKIKKSKGKRNRFFVFILYVIAIAFVLTLLWTTCYSFVTEWNSVMNVLKNIEW